MERARGRLLRAPDHDASTGGGADTSAAPADGAAPADAAPAEQPASTDTSSSEAPQGDTAADPAPDADTSLLGGDVTDDAGKAKESEGEEGKEDEPAARIVPEKYEIAVEGLDLDQSAIEEATEAFKDAGLTNDEVGKLMPAAAKFRDRVVSGTLQKLVDDGAAQKAAWLGETKADPEIGGGKLEETLHLASKALDHFGFEAGSDFRKLLTETGFGNHPGMVRMMRSVGEMLSEDAFPRDGAGQKQADPLGEMYPNNRRSK